MAGAKRPAAATAAADQERSPHLATDLDVDKLMDAFSRPLAGRIAKAPHKDRRLDVRDALATDGQGGHGAPSAATRSPHSSPRKGWTMAGRCSSANRFIGRDLVTTRAAHSPGPIYQPRPFTESPTRPQSFPRGRRLGHTAKQSGPGPGARYDIPSTLAGMDKTRQASPNCKFGSADRFKNKEFISAQHSKVSGSARDVPGPQAYFEGNSRGKQGPAFSFGPEGSAEPPKQRFNEKVFISRLHAGVQGASHVGPAPGSHQQDNSGKDPEGFSRTVSSRSPRAPQWSIGGAQQHHDVGVATPQSADSRSCRARFISAEHAAKDGPARDAHLTPGPGSYFENEQGRESERSPGRDAEARALNAIKKRSPAHSFGVLVDTAKVFVSPSFSADAKGRVSPGPQYFPHEASVQKRNPCFSFADPDPEEAYWKDRFQDTRFLGGGIGAQLGKLSPGPAEYEQPPLPQGPAFSMARRERMLMKRICPAPERARFVSKELAKENYGAYSPGPKYMLAGTLGSAPVSKSPLGTFGVSDREWNETVPQEVRDRHGVKPYTTPGEARFISSRHAEANKGRFSPGPAVYTPVSATLKERPAPTLHLPDGSLPATSPQRVTQSLLSTQRTAPAVSIGGKRPTRIAEDARDSNPVDRLTHRAAPSFGFGTASRAGTGPCQQELGARGDQKKKEQGIEVSPGPGSFTPNYCSVERHVPGTGLGGLTEGYTVDGSRAAPPPKRMLGKK